MVLIQQCVENLRDGVESFVIFSKMILYANNKKLFLSSATIVMILLAMLSYICWAFEGLMYSFTLML